MDDIAARARRAYELAQEILELAEAVKVMPACERVGLLTSLDKRDEELRRLLGIPQRGRPPQAEK